jgi:AcrR family transcriptional regulator
MAAIGLTRGGFYAHFSSKDELVNAILIENSGIVKRLIERKGLDKEELIDEALEAFKWYLNPELRNSIGRHCSMCTLPLDVTRGTKTMRQSYSERIQKVFGEIERTSTTNDDIREKAILSTILAIGGVIIARAVEPKELGDEIEEICFKKIQSILDK